MGLPSVEVPLWDRDGRMVRVLPLRSWSSGRSVEYLLCVLRNSLEAQKDRGLPKSTKGGQERWEE